MTPTLWLASTGFIATAVSFHNFMHLPPVIGMLTGLSYLQFFGYYLKKTVHLEMDMSRHQLETEVDHDEAMGSLPAVTNTRALGMMGVAEVSDAEIARRVTARAFERGLFLRPMGRIVYLWPPLTTTSVELESMLTILGEALADAS